MPVRGGESRHNLVYWRYQDYAGIGPGAHARLTLAGQKWAETRIRLPEKWLAAAEETDEGFAERLQIDADQQLQEALLMGLRLREGVPMDRLPDAQRSVLENEGKLTTLLEEGLLTNDGNILRTTETGRQRLNVVLGYLLG